MSYFLMDVDENLTFKDFVKDLQETFETCAIHIEYEGVTFKMENGTLDKPIHKLLLDKKVTQIACEGDLYHVWVEEVDDGKEINAELAEKFFFTQYNKICDKIRETLPKDYELLSISPNIRCDENGPYLEVQINDKWSSYNDYTTKAYYISDLTQNNLVVSK